MDDNETGTGGPSLDVGPLGDRPVVDSAIERALNRFRSRLAAFGLGTPPSPILAPAPGAPGSAPGGESSEDR
jgi:hypothetical protein